MGDFGAEQTTPIQRRKEPAETRICEAVEIFKEGARGSEQHEH
jgi:hypothetical protein